MSTVIMGLSARNLLGLVTSSQPITLERVSVCMRGHLKASADELISQVKRNKKPFQSSFGSIFFQKGVGLGEAQGLELIDYTAPSFTDLPTRRFACETAPQL